MKIAERLRACVNAAPSNGNVVLTWQTADRLAKALADMDAEQENTRTLDPSIESLQAEVKALRTLVRNYVDPFDVTPADHAMVLALGTDDEEGYRQALAAKEQTR